MVLRVNKYRQWIVSVFATCLAGFIPAVFADDVDITFAGFASLVYAKTISDDKKEGPIYGISDEGEYRDFNKLGFRVKADMQDNLSLTAQVIANGSDNYDPTFDWLFATYKIHPEIALSVGRFREPLFIYSDFLDASYAYQWLEPPQVVYENSAFFKSIEGLKLAYTTTMGEWASELLVWGGNSKAPYEFRDSGLSGDIVAEEQIGLAWTVEREWLLLRGFYFTAETSTDVTTLPPVLQDIVVGSGGPFGISIAGVENAVLGATGKKPDFLAAFLQEKDELNYSGLSAAFEFEQFFILSEFTRVLHPSSSSSLLAAKKTDSYYITGGVRLPAEWTLSLTVGESKAIVDRDAWEQFIPYFGVAGGALDPLLIPYASAMKGLIETMQNKTAQSTVLSARWDFHPSAALKLEYLQDDRKDALTAQKQVRPEAFRIGLNFEF